MACNIAALNCGYRWCFSSCSFSSTPPFLREGIHFYGLPDNVELFSRCKLHRQLLGLLIIFWNARNRSVSHSLLKFLQDIPSSKGMLQKNGFFAMNLLLFPVLSINWCRCMIQSIIALCWVLMWWWKKFLVLMLKEFIPIIRIFS